jgi:cob(I)alamin adenosyltransferase
MRSGFLCERRLNVKRNAGDDLGTSSGSSVHGERKGSKEFPEDRLGLIQVYMGNGKGKTTAALGLTLRACGHELHTYIGQFLKGRSYGELRSVKRLAPFVTIEQYGLDERIHAGEVTLKHQAAAHEGLAKARRALVSTRYDVVVLDEINVALNYGLLTEEEVLELMDSKPPQVELVMTGRAVPQSIIDRADLVTEMREVRHPYSRGIRGRVGIEF